MLKENTYSSTIKKVGFTTIVWNIVLSIIKLIVGVLGKSSAMISDAIHSASDVFTTIIVIIGAKIASKDNDEKHAYGHERFESIASIFLGVILAATAIGIGFSGIRAIIAFNPSAYTPNKLTYMALIGAILSIIVKGLMYIYTIRVANRINSTSLKADAWHHLSDSLSSIGSVLGIVGLLVGRGWEILDHIAAIVICIIILKVAFDIIKSAIEQLVDKSIDNKTSNEIRNKILSLDAVLDIKSFKSRQFGNKIYLDIEIYVISTLSLVDADSIAEELHANLEIDYPLLKHCAIKARPQR